VRARLGPVGLLAVALVVAVLGLDPGKSRAEEVLRVALLQNVPVVTIGSRGGVRGFSADGRPLWRGSVASVTIEDRRPLRINGKAYKVDEVLLRPAAAFPLELQKKSFRGAVRVKRRKSLSVINEVGIEDYLRGVLAMEVSARWHPEVLKVQAVISRTYALFKKEESAGKDYDLVATLWDQVYGGRGAEDPRTDAAIEATRGEVLTYEGAIVFAVFHSTSSGATEDSGERWSVDLPYLKGVSCPRDQESPYYRWEKRIGLDAVEEGLLRSGFSIGALATLTPLSYSKAGRVLMVRILHSKGELILRADDLRRAIGTTLLPSTAFDLVDFGKDLVFDGRGYGHGVGLCQWGAKVLAENGSSYPEILKYYYPGVSLQTR
jgi:stage II sporulation protein D